MLAILEKRSLAKVIRKLPREVLVRYEAWKRIVELEGPQGLRHIKDFHDENLKGEWKNHRSSRLRHKWRIIYRIEDKELIVKIIEINPHDY